MSLLSLLSATDVQQLLAQSVQHKRKQMKLSRPALAQRSTVPAATIKKFETTGQISLRQFILIWQSLGNLDQLAALADEFENKTPRTLDEVLKQ